MCNSCDTKVFNESIELPNNAMLKNRPELFYEWDFEKNNELGLDIYKVTKGSNKKAWWICPKCKSEYDKVINDRANSNHNCPYCRGLRVNHTNSLASLNPELALEWHPTLNGVLTPHDVTCGSKKKVWWKCNVCDSSYNSIIYNKVRQPNCPYCSGQKVNDTNSLASLYPNIVKEWHPTKNDNLTPHDVTVGSGKRVWWLGKCGHEWEVSVKDRVYKDEGVGSKCPICDGKQILIGFNDMWTTNPELAKLLANPEDGYRYTQYSGKKLDWICPDCGELIKDKFISNIRKRQLSCPNCSDGKSYPEKVMYNLLRQLDLEFEWEKTFDWLPDRRYDFYLPDINMIIEVHGEQHYDGSFELMGGRSLDEEIYNDNLKESTAKENGINNYIIINAFKSEIEYLKEQIIHSKLNNLFDLSNINWDEINDKALKSLIVEIIYLWDFGYNTNYISNKMKLPKTTVRRYIRIFNKTETVHLFNDKSSEYTLSENNSYDLLSFMKTLSCSNINETMQLIFTKFQGQMTEEYINHFNNIRSNYPK